MTCFHPVSAFYPLDTTSDGKRYLQFGRNLQKLQNYSSQNLYYLNDDTDFRNFIDFDYQIYQEPHNFPLFYDRNGRVIGYQIKVPCGKCIGCRLDYSRNWAIRSTNEAFMHSHFNNCAFVTLTFNNDMLNRRSNPHSLNKTAFKCWIKRLRKQISTHYGKEIRIMACGEYGTRKLRPHYHLLIYGFNFPDRYVYQYNKVRGRDVLYYRSPFLEKIWTPAHSSESFGYSIIGEVNFESSAYVARYVTKKLFGKYAEKVYKDKEIEFLMTSRMPGLGYDYLLENYKHIFKLGYIVTRNGFKAPIPRYYVNKVKEIDEEIYTNYMMSKQQDLYDNLFVENIDNTQARQVAREELKKLNLDRLVRCYEMDVLLHNIQ